MHVNESSSKPYSDIIILCPVLDDLISLRFMFFNFIVSTIITYLIFLTQGCRKSDGKKRET